jgi:phosphatidylglycerophosphatase A
MKKEELLTTCLGLGKLPIAPGTWGSLPPVVLYQVLRYIPGDFFPAAPLITMVVLLIGFSWICIRYSRVLIAATGTKDPQMIVADEVAGQAVVMLAITLLNPVNICNSTVVGFASFRLFDIVKPWPCRKLEKLPGGLGILADDLMAGVYAAILSYFVIRHWLPQYCG